jgi:hypothetical protein
MNIIDKWDYILVAGGIALLFVYGAGLILFAIAAWRIGNKWSQKISLDARLKEENKEKMFRGMWSDPRQDIALR